MVQDPASFNTDEPTAFAVGVLHGEMEAALEAGNVTSARQALTRILETLSQVRGTQFAAHAYRQFQAVTQSEPSARVPISPLLLASTLRRSIGRVGFSSMRFELGYWASSCRLAAARRDAAFFAGQEARRGWARIRTERLPDAAMNSLDTAQRLLGELPLTEAQWRRLEEAFRQFIVLL